MSNKQIIALFFSCIMVSSYLQASEKGTILLPTFLTLFPDNKKNKHFFSNPTPFHSFYEVDNGKRPVTITEVPGTQFWTTFAYPTSHISKQKSFHESYFKIIYYIGNATISWFKKANCDTGNLTIVGEDSHPRKNHKQYIHYILKKIKNGDPFNKKIDQEAFFINKQKTILPTCLQKNI